MWSQILVFSIKSVFKNLDIVFSHKKPIFKEIIILYLMPNGRQTGGNTDETLKHWRHTVVFINSIDRSQNIFNRFLIANRILICYYILTTKKSSEPVKKKSQWSESEDGGRPKGISVNLLISLDLSLNFSFIKENWEAKPWRP